MKAGYTPFKITGHENQPVVHKTSSIFNSKNYPFIQLAKYIMSSVMRGQNKQPFNSFLSLSRLSFLCCATEPGPHSVHLLDPICSALLMELCVFPAIALGLLSAGNYLKRAAWRNHYINCLFFCGNRGKVAL